VAGRDTRADGRLERGVDLGVRPGERPAPHRLAKGLTAKQVAERLVLSHRTVQNHVQNAMGKLQVHNRAGLVRYAIEAGLDSD
jgi:DNA-binding CsgD family transcriptional regulator